jgi:hypothetical protein
MGICTPPNDLHQQRPTKLAASAPPRFLPSGEYFCYVNFSMINNGHFIVEAAFLLCVYFFQWLHNFCTMFLL